MATTTTSEQLAGQGEDLTGRVAIITGGTRGIGAGISRNLAERGATVAVGFSSNRDAAEKSMATLKGAGANVSLHQGNVGDWEDCQRVVGEVMAQHGRVDILVNNAGITVDRPVQKMTVDDWHKVLRINLSGTFYMTKSVLDHMIERGSGRLINISSVVGSMGNIGQANYAASKAGIFGFTKTLAKECAFALARAGKLEGDNPIGVTVNAISPGLISTEMTRQIPEKVLANLTSQIPVRRMGKPEEIARVVSFLAADAASYVTGQVWAVDGGFDM